MSNPIDIGTFKLACGQYVTGITIVTGTGPGGHRVGLTANSFTSVSLEPPLVLVCIDHGIASFSQIRDAAGYAVHVLSEDQQDLSSRFAMKGLDKFAGLNVSQGLYGAPLLPAAMAIFECQTVARHVAGDHTILIGQVERLTLGDAGVAPLVYFRGKYTTTAGN